MNPICEVPCKPVDEKLTTVWECVKSKVSQKLFFWAFGGLAFFSVVIIGGAQWKIVASISKIDTNVKVMKVTVDNTKINLDKHMRIAGSRDDNFEKRLDSLEYKTYRLKNGSTHLHNQQP